MELKHEKNQTVHDAVSQYVARDRSDKIFQLPFLHIAADTSDVMAATDPGAEQNFRWFNSGLTNKTDNENEYPIEYLYRDVLSKDSILEAISFFLVYVPKQDAEEDKPERHAFTIFPRFHQSRMVQRVAQDALSHFSTTGQLAEKVPYRSFRRVRQDAFHLLACRPSAQSFKPDTNEKVLTMIFLLSEPEVIG